MSAWDRARSIPWSYVSEIDGEDIEHQKEMLNRSLTAEAYEEAVRDLEELESQASPGALRDTKTQAIKPQYETSELLKMAAFGACIGTITGSVFGFMDGMRTAGESEVLKKASNSAKSKYILQGTTRSATLFGGFFGGYHVLKYGLRVTLDPGTPAEIGLAGLASIGIMTSQPTLRPSLPYAGMLLTMDAVSIFMREMGKQ